MFRVLAALLAYQVLPNVVEADFYILHTHSAKIVHLPDCFLVKIVHLPDLFNFPGVLENNTQPKPTSSRRTRLQPFAELFDRDHGRDFFEEGRPHVQRPRRRQDPRQDRSVPRWMRPDTYIFGPVHWVLNHVSKLFRLA